MLTEKEVRRFLFSEGAGPAVVDLVLASRRDALHREQIAAVASRRNAYLAKQIRALAQAAGAETPELETEALFAADKYGASANTLTWALGVMKGDS